MDRTLLWQAAAWPHLLENVVGRVTYKNWSLNLGFYEREVGGEGLTLRIRFPAPDNCDPDDRVVFLVHDFEVPARTFDNAEWQRWVFNCIVSAEQHEAMELFRVDDQQVFFPRHEATADLYHVVHVGHRRSIG